MKLQLGSVTRRSKAVVIQTPVTWSVKKDKQDAVGEPREWVFVETSPDGGVVAQMISH